MLFSCAMVKADHARDSPLSIFVLPQMDKPGFAHLAMVLCPWMQKAMDANLNCAITIQWINFQRPSYKLPLHLATEIVFDSGKNFFPPSCQTVLVMIKLHVFRPE